MYGFWVKGASAGIRKLRVQVMKKVIIITLILIAAMSCAFSATTENHRIQIRSKVGYLDPAFQFEFTSGMLNTTTELITNSSAEIFKNTSYIEFGTNENAVEVADISRNNLLLQFTAKLANRAKSNDSYTLRFNAGGFEVTRAAVPGTLNPSSTEIALSEDIASRGGVKAEMAIPSRLLEHAAMRIVCRLFKEFPQIRSIQLKLEKLNPPMNADIRSAAIEVEVDAEDVMP